MSERKLLWVLALTTIGVIASTQADKPEDRKTVHRLVGGHLKIVQEEISDAELIIASETGGKNDNNKQKQSTDDEKKTLSQQVADGKYGLIQKELFSKPIKRPGIISYERNSEVPRDNINNLGGLSKNEIWLAENHLLVLKGGTYPPHEDIQDNSPPIWPPLDDYEAPKRPVKIPSNPKVPPPFPVQLTEDGPLQILGTNSSRTINGSYESSLYPLLPPEGFDPQGGPFSQPPYPYPANFTPGETPFPIPPYPPPPGEFYPGNGPPPFPLNGTLPPFFGNLPPGAAFLPPPGNQTDFIDEDDPSIYYPPPYSFFYPKDNSSAVPAGPLVPGIVLPPPPNFFAPLDESPTKKKTPPKPTTVPPPHTSTVPVKQIRPTTTPLPPTSVIANRPYQVPVFVPHINSVKPTKVVTIYPIKYNQSAVTTQKPYTPVIRHPSHRKKPQTVTILKPVKPSSTPTPTYNYENNEVSGKPFEVYGPPPAKTKLKATVSTTQVPLKVYFSTSNAIDSNAVTQPPKSNYFTNGRGISTIHLPKTTSKTPAAYYFYEENISTEPPIVIGQHANQNQPGSINQPLPINQPINVNPTVSINRPSQNTQQEQPRGSYFNIPKQYFIRAKPSRPRVEVEIQKIEDQLSDNEFRPINPPQNIRTVQYKPSQVNIQSAQLKGQHHQTYYEPPKGYLQPVRGYVQQTDLNAQQPQYYYMTNRPYVSEKPKYRFVQNTNKPDTFGIHIARLKEQIQSYYTTQKPSIRNVYQTSAKPTPKPVYQFSYQAANYQQQHDAFRNPRIEDNNDKFRPLPHYSVQVQPAIEILPTEAPVYRHTQSPIYFHPKQQTSQRPIQYYSTRQPEYDYEEVSLNNQQNSAYTATPRPISQYSFGVTQNPAYQQGYYTRQEDGYYDDNTKKYFTMFGKKIPAATTPIQYVEATTLNPVRKPVQIQYAQSIRKPVSLEGDTLVNYAQPRPSINQDSEYIQTPQQVKYVPQQQYIKQQPHPLHSDIKVNYKSPRPTQNPNAEIVQAINLPSNKNQDGNGGSFISYQLPGDDGAHFYFLTPQLAQKRNQGVGYYYSQSNSNDRIRRNERREER